MSAAHSAVAAVQDRARDQRDRAITRLRHVVDEQVLDEFVALAMRSRALRLTLNFHPDRIARSGLTVADGLLADGRYRSQWVTGLSSGSRSAIPGGERHSWESQLFDRAYDHADEAVERPVYGGVDLCADVEAIVLDPSFRGHVVESTLRQVAAAYDIELRWHGGSELAAQDIPPDFRGPSVAALARAIGGDGSIDAATIGRAAAARLPDPIAATGDPPDSHLQQVKYLWHAVLALGHDAA